jgi:predicted RecA/RadA family phage recombinase
MDNYVKPGEANTFTAPSGGVVSGGAYMIGSLLVIAAADAAEAALFEGVSVGVFDLPKFDDEEWAEGDKIYFDEDASPSPVFTTEVGSPALPLVGVAVEDIAASPAVATGKVRLDGAAR